MLLRIALLIFVFSVTDASAVAQSGGSGPTVTSDSSVLTNRDVVAMVSEGLSPSVINAKIAASLCKFDTSPQGLADLKSAAVPDDIVVTMLGAKAAPPPPAVSRDTTERQEKIAKERQNAQTRCLGCVGLLVSNFNPSNGSMTNDWLSKNQLAYMRDRSEKLKKTGTPPHFWPTHYRENADFVIVWSSAVGSRPYTMYVPRTSTSTTNVTGDVSLTANTTSTTYVPEHGEHEFVNVVATVYSRDGTKLYESVHQGNWRWSKPDKDCLEDAMNYLSSHQSSH
jgi:hypothetical protein